MILQLAEITINFTVGLALLFGLALLMTALTTKTLQGFFIFLTMFSGFVVWSGLLPLWVLVINIIILTLIIAFNVKSRGQI